MTEAVVVAIVVSVMSPTIVTLLANRSRRAEKLEDWARQDEVAARLLTRQADTDEKVEQVAVQVKADREQIAAKLVESDVKVEQVATTLAATGTTMTKKLDGIHTLVNSDMTARMERELVLMREVVALHEAAGRVPSSTTVAAIATLEKQIADRHAAEAKAKAKNGGQ